MPEIAMVSTVLCNKNTNIISKGGKSENPYLTSLFMFLRGLYKNAILEQLIKPNGKIDSKQGVIYNKDYFYAYGYTKQ